MAQQARTDWQGAQTSTNGQVMSTPSAGASAAQISQLQAALHQAGVPDNVASSMIAQAHGISADPTAQNIYGQNQAQVDQANAAQQSAMAGQNSLVNALQGQNGIGNQSQVYNQAQGLASQLQGMANGTGPSIAQAQLANTTGQNVANQAALMAGQRGAGANVGLEGRQIAQQGAATQQQAAGQSALLRNQEQLGAIGALQNQQGLLGSIAGQQVGNQIGAQNALNSQAAQNQQTQIGALQNQNAQISGNVNQTNAINSGADQQNAKNTNSLIGGALSGIASGGMSLLTGGLGNAAKAIPGGFVGGANQSLITASQGGVMPNLKENYKGKSKVGLHMYNQGGPVKAMVSPGEIYLTPEQAAAVKAGKMNPLDGKRFPGKAPVKGDSSENDIIPEILEGGGVVIKRTKTHSEKAAERFVKAAKSKK